MVFCRFVSFDLEATGVLPEWGADNLAGLNRAQNRFVWLHIAVVADDVAFGLRRGLMQAAMSKERGGIRVAITEVSEYVHRVLSSTQGQYGVSV